MKRKVFVLYEYGADLRPHGSASLRLLLPLRHPSNQNYFEVYSGHEYNGQTVDIVLLDRLWRPDVSVDMVEKLLADVHQGHAKMIYSLDDNFLDIPKKHVNKPEPEKIEVLHYLLRNADGVIVTSKALKDRFQEFNQDIVVLPHALDERLMVLRHPPDFQHVFRREKIIIGYMGTLTHDEDLAMILPALKTTYENHPEIEIQILGAIGKAKTQKLFQDLPVRSYRAGPGEEEYPLFMVWYTGQIDWDIGLAPLRNTPFNRTKSDIKYLDYCAIGAAGIYSDLPPYHDSVRHQETGWLVRNDTEAWVNALEKLVTDGALRYDMARNGYLYLNSQRTLANCAHLWVEAINHFIEET